MLTDREQELVDTLGKVWGEFLAITLPYDSRADDLTEIVHHIHALQDKVLAQAAARVYPEKYRLLGARP